MSAATQTVAVSDSLQSLGAAGRAAVKRRGGACKCVCAYRGKWAASGLDTVREGARGVLVCLFSLLAHSLSGLFGFEASGAHRKGM